MYCVLLSIEYGCFTYLNNKDRHSNCRCHLHKENGIALATELSKKNESLKVFVVSGFIPDYKVAKGGLVFFVFISREAFIIWFKR